MICAGLFGAIFLCDSDLEHFPVQRVNPVELLQGGKKRRKRTKSKLADRSDRNSFVGKRILYCTDDRVTA